MQRLKPESMGDKPSSSSPSSSCKQQPIRPKISEKSSLSSKTKEDPEKFEEGRSSKSEGKKEVRKLKEAIEMSTSSGRQEYLPVNNVKVYLHKPGLEAEPGATAPPPSRACSSPGSSSSSAAMAPSPRCSITGDKGGRGTLYGKGGILDNGTLHVKELSTTAATNCGQLSVARGVGRRQRELQ